MKIKKKNLISWIAVFLMLFSVQGFTSENSTNNEQTDLSFVYGTNHYDGLAYSSTLVPPSIDTFYLIADQTNMVAGRLTRIYHWPLTNEYKADWDEANIVVEGELEILQKNKVLSSVPLSNYVIQYDGLDRYSTIQLYLGEDAVSARMNYENARDQYRSDLYDYYEEMELYREEFQAALEDLAAGVITEEEMPQMPDAQEDFSLFSTELLTGFPVKLPVGKYSVQIRLPDGTIQADSRKDLVVFEAIQKGVGYNVIAEERWTAPEITYETNETIYSLAGKTLFVEAYNQKQYNEQYYTRLNNPQDTQARRDRNIWVPYENADDLTLLVERGNGWVEVDRKDYYVRQIIGSALGYEIVEYDPASDQSVTFSGYELKIFSSRMSFNLVDENGDIIPESSRNIHMLKVDNSWMLYVLSVLPLFVGLVVIISRKRSLDENRHQINPTI